MTVCQRLDVPDHGADGIMGDALRHTRYSNFNVGSYHSQALTSSHQRREALDGNSVMLDMAILKL